MELEPIAFFRSPFTSKFGIPRQSSIIEGLHGTVELAGSYRNADGLRGLEGYDYLWLIWGFSANRDAVKHFTVRPPRLGGNRHVGVWATRSSFRPNNLGLSSVRILSVDKEYCKIDVDGADLMDGTPIFDIKPYIEYADSHPEIRSGFTDSNEWKRLKVELPTSLRTLFTPEQASALEQALSLDPRPHYHTDPHRTYGMPFAGKEIKFHVTEGILIVTEVE